LLEKLKNIIFAQKKTLVPDKKNKSAMKNNKTTIKQH